MFLPTLQEKNPMRNIRTYSFISGVIIPPFSLGLAAVVVFCLISIANRYPQLKFFRNFFFIIYVFGYLWPVLLIFVNLRKNKSLSLGLFLSSAALLILTLPSIEIRKTIELPEIMLFQNAG